MSTVLIAGCSTGFGKPAALTFARQGHTVFASMRNLDKAGPLQDAAVAEGLKIAVVQLDSEPGDPQRVADEIVRVATDANAPLRTLVGSDAELIMAVRTTTDFAGLEETMRTTLNWWD